MVEEIQVEKPEESKPHIETSSQKEKPDLRKVLLTVVMIGLVLVIVVSALYLYLKSIGPIKEPTVTPTQQSSPSAPASPSATSTPSAVSSTSAR